MSPLWLVIFGIGSLLMRSGFALQLSGSLRAKNSAGVVVRLIAESAAAVLAFWSIGFSILFQKHNPWFAFDHTLLFRESPMSVALEFFYTTLCLTAGSIVSSALAERSSFYAGVILSAVMSGLIFPIVGNNIWFGKLHDLGFLDFGGATAIHLSGAVFGAIGIAVLGPRTGKYKSEGTSNSLPGHSLPMLGIGATLLFIGWFPYLLGCSLAHYSTYSQWDDVMLGSIAMKIMLAAAGGVIGGLIYSHRRYRKPDLFFICSGLIGSLVAISAGVVGVTSVGAIVIGLVAGIVVPMVAMQLDVRVRLDDPAGLVSIHGVSAIWGTLATAIFVEVGPDHPVADHFRLLAIHSAGVAGVLILCTIAGSTLFVLLKKLNWLRVSEADELTGLDLAEHGVHAYPAGEN